MTFNQLKRHPLPPFHRTAGFSATATLSRKAFGIDAWPSVIGDDVELRIEAEAIRVDDVSAREAAMPTRPHRAGRPDAGPASTRRHADPTPVRPEPTPDAMTLKNPEIAGARVSQLFHWLIVVLIVVMA